MIELVAIPVVIIPLAVAWVLITAMRGICYFGGNIATDNEKMVKMASEVSLLSWPSKMHDIRYGRGHLREYYVLALRLLMKITGMSGSDHVNIVLALICNAVSAVLIFYIGRYYFGDIAGLFVFFLYIGSLWPYHVAIILGHVLLSQALFLMSLFAITLTTALPAASFPLYLVAGILIGMSFSSSSSSRKFPYLLLVAFLYQSKDFFILPWASDYSFAQLQTGWALAAFGGPALVLIGLAAFGKPIGVALIRLAEVKTGIKRAPERYVELLDFVPRQVRNGAAWGVTILALLFLLQPDGRFYANSAACLAGLGLVAVHVLLPKFIPNVLRYRMWMDATNRFSHFQVWTGHQKEIFGRPLPKNYRGGGIWWTPRFLTRMVPIIVVTYVAALLTLIGTAVAHISSGEVTTTDGVLGIISLIGISLLPIFVSELTRALQLGKAYFPAFVGLLFLIAAGASSIIEVVEGVYWATGILAFLAVGLLLGQAGITGRALVTDIIPARMGPDRLYRFLKKQNIQSFYTYDIPYNNPFTNTMLYSHPNEFAVTYIDSINDADGGIVVVPPTSSKSVEMTSERYGIENGDFRGDLVLAQLLDTKEIERVALAKLSTRGCSRFFVHESEVSTYRDIFLKQINDHDRWLSHAWVIDAKLLNPQSVQDLVPSDSFEGA